MIIRPYSLNIQFRSQNVSFITSSQWKFGPHQLVSYLIIYMQKFYHADWLRACQLIPNSEKTWNFLSAERRNWWRKLKLKMIDRYKKVKKEVTNQAFWLVNGQRNSQIANQIFCFQIKHAPWMAQLMVQILPWCVIRLHSSFTPTSLSCALWNL